MSIEKVHYNIVADAAGTVREVLDEAGNQVAVDAVLIATAPSTDDCTAASASAGPAWQT